jgi:DNA-3-methyladenine glycosylase
MRIPSKRARLPRSFYERPTAEVARDLLGKSLLRKYGGEWIGGLIVETEAYLSSGDPASHSARGETPGNVAMFGRAGTLYVYPIHAKHCMNVVTDPRGKGSAVLIRAIEPVWGVEKMMDHRETESPRHVSRGPAMLCQALRVDRSHDKIDLLESEDLWIATGATEIPEIIATPRIGISTATDLPLRFFLNGNWFVSGRVRDHRTPPTPFQRLVSIPGRPSK